MRAGSPTAPSRREALAMAELIVLSHYQAAPLLAARKAGRRSATTSADLGRTTVKVALTPDDVAFPDGQCVSWGGLRKIADTENQCFVVEDGGVRAIQVFSEATSWARSLYPTPGAPTTLVAGFPMHRIRDTDPLQDTRKKIEALAPISGDVLDTATGLGYTAIELTRLAEHVTTIEVDPAAIEIASMNPWSRELFDNPRITLIIGDAYERIQYFPDASFTRVLHDPPTFSLAGELYSESFYRHVLRILGPSGRMFHYIGDPTSKFGRRMTTGVVERLQSAGFRRVVRKPEAFGVVAYK
jgi:predicted methyltransferase